MVGALRTAEEFTAAFDDRQVVTSGGSTVLDSVEPNRHLLVLATPGAEPRIHGGYRLVVLLDTWLMLARDDVRVVEESYRRWFNALALAAHGAPAVAVGESGVLQGLVRADPAGVAARELQQRTETHLPPVGRLATVEGTTDELAALAARAWTPHTEVLGPVEDDRGDERLILRAPRSEGLALADLLKANSAARSAEKLPVMRVRVDPLVF